MSPDTLRLIGGVLVGVNIGVIICIPIFILSLHRPLAALITAVALRILRKE